MKIAPVDIRNQQFKKVVRGADPEEVRIFLAIVADEMEIIINENRDYEEKLSALQVQVEEYKKVEMALRDTLLTAERLSSEAKDNSRKEAELILRDAGLKAERILDEASRRACVLRKEIVELKNQKDIYIARLRSLVETQLKMLRFHSVDLEEQEGTIAKLERAQSLLGLDLDQAPDASRPSEGESPSETESAEEEDSSEKLPYVEIRSTDDE
ncbi:MAG: DivIVA domain-containing protein [Candidatus Eiseniibacteriota bacterium]|nr:MAG: DivIVA domain-containing protein [Candidatus Eisenbacteria bacterium]